MKENYNISITSLLYRVSLLFVTVLPVCAQSPFLYLDDSVYEYFDYAVTSGGVATDFVLQQPYTLQQLNGDTADNPAAKYFRAWWKRFYGKANLSGQLQLAERLRLKNNLFSRYKLAGSLHYKADHILLANRTVVDQDFRLDPNYAGDLSEAGDWIYGRVNEAYGKVAFNGFSLFAGRVKRNWGAPGEKGLLLSDNPYSYDHFLAQYTNRWFRFSLILAQLENINALTLSEPGAAIKRVNNANRYLVGHRIDISLNPTLQFAFTEMATFGGANRNIDLQLLNPMTFYYGVQRNDRRQLDGFWALDVFWKPFPKTALYTQFLIDDIIVNNDPGVDDRSRFPDRLGINISLRQADWPVRGLQNSITFNRIWNRTYQSKFTWENYHYRGLGLGYPCASCEEFKWKIAWWGAFPWYVQNELIVGRYGGFSFYDVFPLEKNDFPLAPVTDNLVNELLIRYFYFPALRGFLSVHYFKEPNHYRNRIDNLPGVYFKFGIEYLLSENIL